MEGEQPRTRSRFLIDLSPLREYREFRWLWTGELISEIGSWISTTLVYIQVFRLSGENNLAVGAVGFVQLVPLLFTSLVLGVLIDRHDRRRVLQVATGVQWAASVLLFTTAVLDLKSLPLVYLATGLTAGAGGVAHATRVAITPSLVPEELLPSAISLNQAMWNSALIAGPALGGLIADSSLALGYGIDVVSFIAVFIGLWALNPRPAAAVDGRTRGRGLAGIRYVRSQRVLVGSFGIDLVAMTFGMPRALFPSLAASRFDVGESAVGYLLAAISAGALLGSLSSGWTRGVQRQGRAVVASVVVWGAAIAAFGLSGSSLLLAMLLLAVAGAADVISAVFRGAILQRRIPEAMRGQISGIHIAVVTGGPRLGDMEAGAVAALTNVTTSVVSGGVACMAGAALVAIAVPDFWQERTPATG